MSLVMIISNDYSFFQRACEDINFFFFFNRIVFKIELGFYKNYYTKDKENRNRRYSEIQFILIIFKIIAFYY